MRIVGKAVTVGSREYQWPYQRIEVYQELVRESLKIIKAWDNGRSWYTHDGVPSQCSTRGRWESG